MPSSDPKADPSLLVISTAPARKQEEGLLLDRKFVDGMRLYAECWNGRVGCLLPENHRPQPFGEVFDAATLPFEVRLHPHAQSIVVADLDRYDVILCSGDSDQYLHLADLCLKAGKTILFIIEYIPETRRQIVMLDQARSLPKKLKSILNIQYHERRRRKAFAQAAGLQANGYPAAAHYRAVNADTLLYLDNRIDAALLATADDMASRRDHMTAGGPLRLLHSGRLEPMKGSQDLLPIAGRLRDRGIDFVLDIFGSGSLEPAMRKEIDRTGLQDRVRLHGVADFATGLVPFARTHSDIYLSCHRQSDPSCSYLENMGCGLAVAGYDNRMWAALAAESRAGWVVPLGDWKALADLLAGLDRKQILECCDKARDFAAAHLFEQEFEKRIAQLRALQPAR